MHMWPHFFLSVREMMNHRCKVDVLLEEHKEEGALNIAPVFR